MAAEELGVITGSAMLKDETRCIRCGLCAERCPVNVITMEAYSIVGQTSRSAADVYVGLPAKERVLEDPRRTGVLPH